MNNKKIAVFFPGIGYHCDKPLLYYARKIALEVGYEEYRNVNYSCKVEKIRGDKEKMKQAFDELYKQAKELLQDINWDEYDDILFVSKSIGTAIALAYAGQREIKNVRHILYTPLEETFIPVKGAVKGIAFIGSKDPWSDVPKVVDISNSLGIPIHLYENANHSLETDDTITNLKIIKDVMGKTKACLRNECN